MSTNMCDIFLERAAEQPEHTALIGPGRAETLSYSMLANQIEALSASLRSAGIKPGDCIGLHLPSGREYIIASYAIWRCGACVVPIPVELKPNEKREITSTIAISLVISKAATKSVVDHFQSGDEEAVDDKTIVFAMKSPVEHPAGFHDVNAAFIRFSSGTTGTSKGVVLSHETVFDRIHAANEVLNVSPKDRVIWLLSMSYHFTVSIVSYLSFGATVVLPDNYFAKGILSATLEHGGTFIYGSPVHYHSMAKDKTEAMLDNVRLAISTTTGLSSEIGDAFHDRFGIHLTQAYGIIEIGLPCINLHSAVEQCDSVGHVLPAFDVNLEKDSQDAEFGEILIRGKGILDAYYAPWKTRAEILKGGWFRTGDLGQFDEDRCLRILGRSKEILSVSGMKFFPQEVEEVLNAVPGVAQSAVFPCPHDRLGEVPHAHVVLQGDFQPAPTEDELRRECMKQLAAFKVPEKIILVEELELTASGKILRRTLASRAAQEKVKVGAN